MAKGASIKFKSYEETIPKLLEILKLPKELKKYDTIVLKPTVTDSLNDSTPKEFIESVIKFCNQHKNPVTEIFIAEGADGYETLDRFDSLGYKNLAERYGISLLDLNNAETEEIENPDFLKFSKIHYPKILLGSFVISLSKLSANEETDFSGSLSSMLGAFPASHYMGFFSQTKNKIRKWPIEYSIHDIIRCKMPDLAVVDASAHGSILAGLPLEIDKQSAKILDLDWRNVSHLRLINEVFSEPDLSQKETKQKLY